jgi:hypothetical protein
VNVVTEHKSVEVGVGVFVGVSLCVPFGVSVTTKYGNDFLACQGTVTGTKYCAPAGGTTPAGQVYNDSNLTDPWTPAEGIGIYLFQFGGSTKFAVLVGATGIVNSATNCVGVSPSVSLTPSLTATPSLTPSSTPAPTPSLTPTTTPSLTPTPTPSAALGYAFVDIANDTAGTEITNITIGGVQVDGAVFPIVAGDGASATTTETGASKTIIVSYTNVSNDSVEVIDTASNVTCISATSTARAFAGQVVSDGGTLTIAMFDGTCP